MFDEKGVIVNDTIINPIHQEEARKILKGLGLIDESKPREAIHISQKTRAEGFIQDHYSLDNHPSEIKGR